MSVHPSIKSSSISLEIWRLGTGQWVICDGMPCDRIQSHGHETFKFRISSHFKTISNAIYKWSWFLTCRTISKFIQARFLKTYTLGVEHFTIWDEFLHFAHPSAFRCWSWFWILCVCVIFSVIKCYNSITGSCDLYLPLFELNSENTLSIFHWQMLF